MLARNQSSIQRLGHEEGRREGRREGEAALLQLLLVSRFGTLPEAIQTRLVQASISQLQTWGQRILVAATLDEVFEDNPSH